MAWFEKHLLYHFIKEQLQSQSGITANGTAKEMITIDVYGDTAEIIEDCLDDLQPFIDEVIPKEESEGGTDFSEDNYIEQISEFLAWN